MNDVITILLITLSEIALIEMIALFIIFKRRKNSSQSVDPEEARTTYKSIRGNDNHRNTISEILTAVYDVDNEKLEEKLDTILEAEYAIYRTGIKGVATGNCNAIVATQKHVSELQEQYHSLVRILKANFDKGIDHLESCNKDLQVDVEKLRHELSSTLVTMESTLSEYSNMYAAKMATDEGDEKLQKLQESVVNSRQHADHAIKKTEEGAEEKRVAIKQEEIDARIEAKMSSGNTQQESLNSENTESIDSETKQDNVEKEAKAEQDNKQNAEISFETMGDMEDSTDLSSVLDQSESKEADVSISTILENTKNSEEPKPPESESKEPDFSISALLEDSEESKTTKPEIKSRNDAAPVETNIDNEIYNIQAAEDLDSSSTAVATEEEISSFLLENNLPDENIESELVIDPEADADIADLLNDANDIDLSDDFGDLDADLSLDSQLHDSELKTVSKG